MVERIFGVVECLIQTEAVGSAIVLSLLSFVGLAFFYCRERTIDRLMLALSSFASGMLVGVSFLHSLPAALEETGFVTEGSGFVFSIVLFGVVVCFLLERVFYWRHLHEGITEIMPLTPINALGDAVHYFIVGAGLAAAFHISSSVGFWMFVAFFLHTVPQELSDSAQLLHGGAGRGRMLGINLASSIFAVVGAVIVSVLFDLGRIAPYLLAFIAGFMLYAGIVDITFRARPEKIEKRSVMQLAFFIAAVVLVQAVQMVG